LIPKGVEIRHLEVPPKRKAAKHVKKSTITTAQKAGKTGYVTRFTYS